MGCFGVVCLTILVFVCFLFLYVCFTCCCVVVLGCRFVDCVLFVLVLCVFVCLFGWFCVCVAFSVFVIVVF